MDFKGVYPYGNFRNYYNLRKYRPTAATATEEGEGEGEEEEAQASASTFASYGNDLHTSRRTDLDPRVFALLQWLQSREELDQQFEGGEDEVAVKSSLKKKESQDIPLKRTFDRILDIGTNSGKVAIELAQIVSPSPSLVMGIDIDNELISSAEFTLRGAFTTWAPRPSNSPLKSSTNNTSDTKKEEPKLQSLSETRQNKEIALPPEATYFPSSFSTLFGALPLPPPDFRGSDFPHNVRFLAVDWMKEVQGMGLEGPTTQDSSDEAASFEMKTENQRGWDMILGLSITKWIHLHHRDLGIRKLFASIASLLCPGGCFVLERQRIGSYASSRRALAKEGYHLDANGLKLHPDDFGLILTVEMGLIGPIRVGEIIGNGFVRPLDIFVQPLTRPSQSVVDFRKACLDAPPAKPKSQTPIIDAESSQTATTGPQMKDGQTEKDASAVQDGNEVLVPWVKRKWKVK